jgi:hypothetical protein
MPTTDAPTYPTTPTFGRAFLDHLRKPETPLPQDPSTKPPKPTSPLAASPQPAKFYSQYKCAICNTRIADQEDADFIGHHPCRHRSTCQKPSCVRAYYGTPNKWATPYTGTTPLYCQASGCGRQIEEWCAYHAQLAQSGNACFAIGMVDPKRMEAYQKAVKEREKEAKRERKEKKKKEKKEKKERRGSGCDGVDCLAGTLLCCSFVFCCGIRLA